MADLMTNGASMAKRRSILTTVCFTQLKGSHIYEIGRVQTYHRFVFINLPKEGFHLGEKMVIHNTSFKPNSGCLLSRSFHCSSCFDCLRLRPAATKGTGLSSIHVLNQYSAKWVSITSNIDII